MVSVVGRSIVGLSRRAALGVAAGWAVRREWPDGAHEFIQFGLEPLRLVRWIERDRVVWRRSPIYPSRWVVVAISGRDFELHRGRTLCVSPDCPDEDVPREPATGVWVSGVDGAEVDGWVDG